MTDAAPAAAPAAPAPSSVPIDTGAAQVPNPAETSNIARHEEPAQRGQPESGAERAERKSIDDIIKASHEKVTKQAEAGTKEPPKPAPEAKGKPEPGKETPKQEAQRQHGPDGKFQSRQPPQGQDQQQPAPKPVTGQHAEAPNRFSPDAKTEWASAPESVRAETHRAIRELEQGYHKHRADAEAYNTVRDFDQFAKQNGGTLRQVLANYATLERQLVQGDAQTKDMALTKVFQRAGVNPHEWAARILNQPPEQRDAQRDQTITALRTQIAQLQAAVQGVTSHVQQQQSATLSSSVTEFAKANPRFDELSDGGLENNIQNILRSNLIPQDMPPQERLQKAYDMADRLNPATAPRQPSSGGPAAPSNDAGTKSIAGPPATGSDPTIPGKKKGERVSIDDALKRAHQRLAS